MKPIAPVRAAVVRSALPVDLAVTTLGVDCLHAVNRVMVSHAIEHLLRIDRHGRVKRFQNRLGRPMSL